MRHLLLLSALSTLLPLCAPSTTPEGGAAGAVTASATCSATSTATACGEGMACADDSTCPADYYCKPDACAVGGCAHAGCVVSQIQGRVCDRPRQCAEACCVDGVCQSARFCGTGTGTVIVPGGG